MSPTHLIQACGLVLIVAGAFVAAPVSRAGLISLTCAFSIVTVYTQYGSALLPLGFGAAPLIVTDLEQSRSALVVLWSTVPATMAMLLLLKRTDARPVRGALTFLFGVNALAMATQNNYYVSVAAAIAAGLAGDLLVALLVRKIRKPVLLSFVAGCVPALYWALHDLTFVVNGQPSYYDPGIRSGFPIVAGLVGLLVRYAMFE